MLTYKQLVTKGEEWGIDPAAALIRTSSPAEILDAWFSIRARAPKTMEQAQLDAEILSAMDWLGNYGGVFHMIYERGQYVWTWNSPPPLIAQRAFGSPENIPTAPNVPPEIKERTIEDDLQGAARHLSSVELQRMPPWMIQMAMSLATSTLIPYLDTAKPNWVKDAAPVLVPLRDILNAKYP